MESDEDDISWWRADARDLARWTVRTVRGITRADLIFTGYALVLCVVGIFVWPATPIMSLIWLLLAVRLFLWPDHAVRAVKKRMEEGGDSYFEEQRALRSYPIGNSPAASPESRLDGRLLRGWGGAVCLRLQAPPRRMTTSRYDFLFARAVDPAPDAMHGG